ncbi:multidrug effflux MFS transporter [Pedobacter sp. L105]|uniref:multidrug effflux MFS transporter n=1 Tax=Pedobacter sp. L105 TaxID=1641871 RepID=UPI00131D55BA|nr:multidrug effflux MFS transporter [Pedobacter sp. L105]
MKDSRKTLLITLTLGILTAISSISIDLYLPAFPVMAAYFQVPIVRIETTVTLFLFGMCFGQLIIGPLSDIWGRKIPLRIGMAIYVVCSICCMLTHSYLLFLGLRFIQGLAGSSCQVISRALVSDLYKGRQAAQIFSLLQILMGISPIIAPIIGGLLAETNTWKYLFLIMAIVSGVGLIGCVTILPEGKLALLNKSVKLRSIGSAYRYCIKSPAFINYALVRAVSNSAAFSFVTASPFVLTQIYKLSKGQFGFVFSGFALGIIFIGFINNRLLLKSDIKTIIRNAIIVQLLAGLAAILVVYFNGSLLLLLVPVFIFLAMLSFILSNSTALYLNAVSSHGGAASALVGSMSYLSAFLITSLLSLLYNKTAYPMLLMMIACAMVAIGCLLYRRR